MGESETEDLNATLQLLLQDYAISRQEMAQALSQNQKVVTFSSGLSAIAIAAFSMTLNTGMPNGGWEYATIPFGMFVLFLSMYLAWGATNFAFIVARAYHEINTLRRIALDIGADDRLLTWDVGGNRYKTIWWNAGALVTLLLFFVILSMQFIYVYYASDIDYTAILPGFIGDVVSVFISAMYGITDAITLIIFILIFSWIRKDFQYS